MEIKISPEAASWYKRELSLKAGDAIRLFPRYSSGGGLHPGFSLGIAGDRPVTAGAQTEQEGILFFMEEQDLWYMDGHNLTITYSAAEDDIEYGYERPQEAGGVKE